MRGLVLAIAVVLAGCGGSKAESVREAELGEYAKLVPKRGAYVRLLNAEGERWRAVFDADWDVIEIKGVWQTKDGEWSTMRIAPERTQKLWALAAEVLAHPQAPFTHQPDLRLELAIADGDDKAVLIKTQGPFVDGPAKQLFEGIKGWVPDPGDSANQAH